MIITSGQGTNIIQVSVSNTYTGGDLTVEARNSCGSSPVRIKNLGLNLALSPDPISGASSGLCGASGVVFSTSGSANASGYLWTVPSGVTLLSGQGSSNITVDISSGFATGTLTVQGLNGCGLGSARSLSIQGKPFINGSISGTQNICPGALNVPYGIGTVSGATSYTWTPPGGSTVSSGQGTKNILVSYGSTAASNQSLSLRASNACGVSNAKTLGGITISNSFCGLRFGASESASGIEMLMRPNPVHDLVTFDIQLLHSQRITLILTDMTGRLIHSEQLELPSGSSSLSRDFSYLSAGIYALSMSYSGHQARQLMVVK